MKSRGTQRQLHRAAAVVACALWGLGTLACAQGTGGGNGSGSPSASTESGSSGVSEQTAAIGQSVEVAGLTSTVTEVHRQKSFGPNAEEGYVVAQVTVANTSSGAQDYHRLQWDLRLPDGSSIKRTPIVGQTQLGQGELEPGAQVSGSLIFTVQDKGGEFALMFEPRQDDKPEKKRGLWPFTSQPGDAR